MVVTNFTFHQIVQKGVGGSGTCLVCGRSKFTKILKVFFAGDRIQWTRQEKEKAPTAQV